MHPIEDERPAFRRAKNFRGHLDWSFSVDLRDTDRPADGGAFLSDTDVHRFALERILHLAVRYRSAPDCHSRRAFAANVDRHRDGAFVEIDSVGIRPRDSVPSHW